MSDHKRAYSVELESGPGCRIQQLPLLAEEIAVHGGEASDSNATQVPHTEFPLQQDQIAGHHCPINLDIYSLHPRWHC